MRRYRVTRGEAARLRKPRYLSPKGTGMTHKLHLLRLNTSPQMLEAEVSDELYDALVEGISRLGPRGGWQDDIPRALWIDLIDDATPEADES